jgi:hypothetical protein
VVVETVQVNDVSVFVSKEFTAFEELLTLEDVHLLETICSLDCAPDIENAIIFDDVHPGAPLPWKFTAALVPSNIDEVGGTPKWCSCSRTVRRWARHWGRWARHWGRWARHWGRWARHWGLIVVGVWISLNSTFGGTMHTAKSSTDDCSKMIIAPSELGINPVTFTVHFVDILDRSSRSIHLNNKK